MAQLTLYKRLCKWQVRCFSVQAAGEKVQTGADFKKNIS